MKKIFIAIFYFFIIVNSLYSQDYYKKFKNSYFYIDSLQIDNYQKFNVCPIIRFISTKSFINSIYKTDTIKIDNISYENNVFFSAFFDTSLDSIFNNKIVHDRFLTFSKPIGNTLIAEIKSGNYNYESVSKIPYFGDSIVFLFIFDENDNIIKVYNQYLINN